MSSRFNWLENMVAKDYLNSGTGLTAQPVMVCRSSGSDWRNYEDPFWVDEQTGQLITQPGEHGDYEVNVLLLEI